MEQSCRGLIVLLSGIAAVLSGCTGVGIGSPSPEEMIQRHIQAAYGDEGLDAQSSITMEGRLVIEEFDVDAPVVMKMEAPDKRSFASDVMGQKVIRSCAEGRCWTRELNAELQSLGGAQLEFMQELSDFKRLENLRRYYRHMEAGGTAEFNGKQANVLRLVRHNGLQDTWYFDRESGLWLGGTWRLPREMGGLQVTQYFEEYKEFDGIRLATEVTEVTPEQTSRVIIEEVSFDDIPDREFYLAR
ncbi:hypothetical protein ACXYTJ_06540 [Gilvimarinus sp. F26214L]|uniref:hypothetical protein n=1 Tax=Gilvimarinus sp. DZF01 TaxID=3461371 RepID=UPI004045829D